MLLTYLMSLLPLVSSSSLPPRQGSSTKPAAFFLAGDSTTAIISSDGGGWGDGFLGTLVHGAIGINWGQNGATTESFVAKGNWTSVIDSVTKYKQNYTTYVTIQFGHNDQKSTTETTEDFKTNLKNLCDDVKTAGGIPILVTSISRRDYNSSGVVEENLAVPAAATLEVAASINSAYIDLNKASTVYLDAIGKDDGNLYDLGGTDKTHLNAEGGVLFGNMVAELLQSSAVAAAISPYVSPNSTIVDDIKAGKFILPSVPAGEAP